MLAPIGNGVYGGGVSLTHEETDMLGIRRRRYTVEQQVLDLTFNPINLNWVEYQPGHFRGTIIIGTRNVVPIGNTDKPFNIMAFYDARLAILIRRDRQGHLFHVRQIFGRNRRGWTNKPIFEFSVPFGICKESK